MIMTLQAMGIFSSVCCLLGSSVWTFGPQKLRLNKRIGTYIGHGCQVAVLSQYKVHSLKFQYSTGVRVQSCSCNVKNSYTIGCRITLKRTTLPHLPLQSS